MFGFKAMEWSKCPWCAESVDTTQAQQYDGKTKLYLSLDVGIVLTVGTYFCILFVLRSFSKGPHLYGIGGCSCIAIQFVYVVTSRYYPLFKKGERKCASEPELGRALIRWYSIRQGGIGLPRLRLINNMIFPVRFFAADGTPISEVLYVRIQKRYGLFWKKARVRMIAVPVQDQGGERNIIWYRAQKFLIYNYGHVIGEGNIVPAELKC